LHWTGNVWEVWPLSVFYNAMFIIVRRHNTKPTWLRSVAPEGWGERDHAMMFETRNEARRVALSIRLNGDWNIEASAPSPTGHWPNQW